MARPGLLAGLCRGSWLLLGAALFVAPPAWGDDALLLGAWEGGDRATRAIYGRLLVTPAFVKWSGSRANPACRVRYRLVTRKEAGAYPDALPGFDAAPGVPGYTVFRLALQRRACTRGRTALQFAIPVAKPARAELVTYDRRGRPVSWGHLDRPDGR